MATGIHCCDVKKRLGIGHGDGRGIHSRAEGDAARGRSYDGLHDVVHRIEARDLVGDELDHEQHHEDEEHPLVGEPRPRGRQLDEARETVEGPDHDERDPGVEPGRQREPGPRQQFEHLHLPDVRGPSGRVSHG